MCVCFFGGATPTKTHNHVGDSVKAWWRIPLLFEYPSWLGTQNFEIGLEIKSVNLGLR